MVLGLNSDGPEVADLEIFVASFGITFPILPEAQTVRTLYSQPGGLSPFPLDYIIDQAGRVAYVNTEYDPDFMADIIEDLIDNPVAVNGPPAASAATLQVWPNPFNPRAQIALSLPRTGPVSLDVVDARGHVVRRLLVAAELPAGRHVVIWDGLDDAGRAMPSGVYLARVLADGLTSARKLTLVR